MIASNQLTEWEELKAGYNRIYHTNFETPQALLQYLYAKEKHLGKVGDIFGITGRTVGKYMKRWDIPRLPSGHRYPGPCLQKILALGDDVADMTYLEIAKIIGCSGPRVCVLLKENRIIYKRLRKWTAKA